MQEQRVRELQDRKLAVFKKIAGTDNEADFFTKVVTLQEIKVMERLMPKKPDPGSPGACSKVAQAHGHCGPGQRETRALVDTGVKPECQDKGQDKVRS